MHPNKQIIIKHMTSNERDTELIKRLRQQVHKSFMQISQMEKLFHLEMEHTKQEFDEREKLIKQKQDDIKQKYALIETNMRLKQSSFLMQMGDLDVSLDEIAYKKEDTMRDSGIEKIKELLAAEEKNLNTDPQAQMNKLRELQSSITSCLTSVPTQLYQLFQISNEMCLDNCRLKEELLNYQETHDVYKTQIIECQRMIEKLKRSQRNLKQHNQQLNDLYVQEASQNAIVQQEIRIVREELNQKKMETDNLRQQISKLSQLYKPSNKIDMNKVNFKYPLNNKSRDEVCQKQKPNFLRMSSNAVLIRNYKPNTPQPSTMTEDSDVSSPSQFLNVQSGAKYFKRKIQKIDRIQKIDKTVK